MKKAWSSWVRIVKIIIGIQTTIILFVIYYLVILPMGIGIKIFSKNSLSGHEQKSKKNSLWNPRQKIKQNLAWSRAQ